MKTAVILAAILVLAAVARLYHLDRLPNGLHWDEMDTGYQAYSLYKTGRDYFGSPALLSVHSIADFRGPVFIYSAVPFVSRLGLTPVSVRLPAVVWSLVFIVSLFCLGQLILRRTGLIAAAVAALSPWHLQYSRQSVETMSAAALFLTGLACFMRALSRPRWLIPSALLFALAPAAYAPLKLFVPLFLAGLAWIHRRRIRSLPARPLILSLAVFSLVFIPVFADGLLGPSSLRARQLSVFSDPTVPDTVNNRREQLQITSGIPKIVGLSPRPVDRLVHNKLTVWGSTIAKNYFRALGPEFLFLTGDANLRHSPDPRGVGMLHIAEAVPLLLGLYLLIRNRRTVLGLWLVLAPVSASLTREGNPHAARLLILLPALVITISLGLHRLLKKRLLFALYSFLWLASAVYNFAYFFGNYRWESAAPFQYGFSRAVSTAVDLSPQYDRVILDFASDSPLMAYLYSTAYDPAIFQSGHPYPQTEVLPGVNSLKLGNLFLLPPGHYPWDDFFSRQAISGKTLLVVSSANPSGTKIGSPVQVISYPDSAPAFYIFTR